jgi:hypothetical protein
MVPYVCAVHASLDVMHHHTLLHVAYHLTSCGKWIMACGVDQRDKAYDLGPGGLVDQGPGRTSRQCRQCSPMSLQV